MNPRDSTCSHHTRSFRHSHNRIQRDRSTAIRRASRSLPRESRSNHSTLVSDQTIQQDSRNRLHNPSSHHHCSSIPPCSSRSATSAFQSQLQDQRCIPQERPSETTNPRDSTCSHHTRSFRHSHNRIQRDTSVFRIVSLSLLSLVVIHIHQVLLFFCCYPMDSNILLHIPASFLVCSSNLVRKVVECI